MNTETYWSQLGLRKKLDNQDIQYALAVFACIYSETKEQVISFEDFNSLS